MPRTIALHCLRYPVARAARLQYRTTRPEQRVVGFGAFGVEYDNDVAEHRCIWIGGEVAPCEAIVVTW